MATFSCTALKAASAEQAFYLKGPEMLRISLQNVIPCYLKVLRNCSLFLNEEIDVEL
jgi:hypothetical protein